MDEKKLGLYAYVAKSLFKNCNYLCLFTENKLLVLENEKMEDYVEEKKSEEKQSFFARVKNAFQAGTINHHISEEKMLANKNSIVYNRQNTSNVSYDISINKLSFFDEDGHVITFSFDYDPEELLLFIRKIFGIIEDNIKY